MVAFAETPVSVRRHVDVRGAAPAALAAVAVGIAWSGGSGGHAQWAFAGLGIATLVVAPLGALRLREPALAVLAALAALGALSSLWTIGRPADALRWAAVTAALAAIAASVAHARLSPRVIAGLIVAAALATGVLGLVSAARFSPVFADWLEGGWKPEGPFGYAPALALLQVFALPAVISAMAGGRARWAMPAAVAGTSGAGVLALSSSRLAIALATFVALAALALPVAPRVRTVAAVAFLCVGGLALHEALGGWVSRRPHDAGYGRTAVLVALLAGAGPAWLVLRRWVGGGATSAPARTRQRSVLLVAAAAVAVCLALLTAGPLDARRFGTGHGLTDGRSWIWRVAGETAADRPLVGSGSETFLQATLERQPGHGRLMRYAHDLPLELAVELGVLGLVLALALFGSTALTLRRALGSPAAWLLGPVVLAFLVANLVDWPWHFAGVGGLFALALGGLLGAAHPDRGAARRPGEAERPSRPSLPR